MEKARAVTEALAFLIINKVLFLSESTLLNSKSWRINY